MSDTEMTDVSASQPWEEYATGKYDAQWETFAKTAFKRMEDSYVGLPKEVDDVDIHPLFAPSQFRLIGGEPELISDADYAAIQPAVRLASRILDSSALDDFWHALWCGRTYAFEDPDDRKNIYGHEIDEKDLICPDDNNLEVRRSVRALAEFSHFCLDIKKENQTENSTRTKLNQETQTNTHAQYTAIPDLDGFKGWISYTVIGEYTWQHAVKSKRTGLLAGDVPYMLAKQFDLAVTLLHEAAHAYRNARFPRDVDFEPYFGKDIISEVGFKLESELFGGHLTEFFHGSCHYQYYDRVLGWTKSQQEGLMLMWEWPYQYQKNEYTCDEGKDKGKTVSGFGARREPKDVRALDVAWRVPLNFLKDLFCDDFWNSVYPNNPSALKAPRNKGYCFRAEKPYTHPVQRAFDHIEEAKYVPKGHYHKTGSVNIGMIVPSNRFDDDVNPVHAREDIFQALVKNRHRWDRPFEAGGRYHGKDLNRIIKEYPYYKETWAKEEAEAKLAKSNSRFELYRRSKSPQRRPKNPSVAK